MMRRGQVPACFPLRGESGPLGRIGFAPFPDPLRGLSGRRAPWHVGAPLVLLLVLLLGSLARIGDVSALELTRTVYFTRDEVRLAPTPSGLSVEMNDCTVAWRGGMPALPARSFFIALPPGEEAATVEIVERESEDLGVWPAPRRGPVPMGVEIPGPTGEYPAVAGEHGDTQYLRGQALQPVQVWPVSWDPRTGRARLRSRVDVVVTTRPARAGAWHTLRPTDPAAPEFDALARRMVVNPEMLASSAANAARVERTLEPLDSAGNPFSPRFRPSVDGSAVDYVIITNDALSPQFQVLADWKTRSGLTTVVRTVDWIRTNYPNGVDVADTIRRFIADAAARWGTRYVLLGGDADIVPVRYGRTNFFGGENIPADMYYQCLDGNWNTDGDAYFGEGYGDAVNTGDGCDLMPDVWLGRASLSDTVSAAAFIGKVLTYEKNPPQTGGYPVNALFMAEVLFPQVYTPGDSILYDGAGVAEQALSYFPPTIGVTRLYENYPAYAGVGALPETKSTVIDKVNSGFGYIQHIGHGYINTMAVGLGGQTLDNNDAAAFTNGGKAGVLYAINCTSAAIDYNCLGEEWLKNPNGGAVADIGSTRFDFPATGTNYQNEFYNLVFNGHAGSIGEAFADAKAAFVPMSTYDSEDRWTQFAQILLGEPSMPLWSDTPTAMVVTHPASLQLGGPAINIHVTRLGVPVDSARVCFYKPGDDYRTALTDANGDVSLLFRPDRAGTAYLTVTAPNCLPYEVNVPVTAPGSPHLFATTTAISDIGAPAVGNGDGIFDLNETVRLNLVLENEGTAPATGITATLTSGDANLQVVDGSGGYPDLAVGQSAAPSNTFLVKALGSATDRYETKATLTITANGGAYVRSEPVVVLIGAPLLERYQISISDVGVGNGNGIIEANEDQLLTCKVRNNGRGTVRTLLGKLRALDAQTVITDSVSTYGDVGADQVNNGDTFTFRFTDSNMHAIRLVLESNKKGLLVADIDVVKPTAPGVPSLSGKASSITLTWTPVTDTDVRGYVIYRGTTAGGPYTRVNAYADNRIAYYDDVNLQALTRYYYRVSTIDLSGNESALSSEATATTTLPLSFGFPVPLAGATSSSPGMSYFNGDSIPEIVCSSNEVYVMSGNGIELKDGDFDARTYGVFTQTFNATYWSPPSSSDVDRDGVIDVASASWSVGNLYLFDGRNAVKPGFPVSLNPANTVAHVWSAPAMVDVDGDGQMEIFINSDSRCFAFRNNGQELIDGDNNPATLGVFAVMGSGSNYSTPIVTDLDGDHVPEVIIASRDRNLYVKRLNGTNYPGFPFLCAGDITSTPAVGDINNDGLPEIVWGSSDNKLHAMNILKQYITGFPKGVNFNQDLDSSPALGDMNNDGYLDIAVCSGNGTAYVFSGQSGNTLPGYPVILTDALGARIQIRSSPAIANIDQNPDLEMIFGGQDGNVYALKNNGTMALGFPIKTGNVIEGAPLVWDLDHDGYNEVCVQGFDQFLYMWDTPAPFTATSNPWPMFAHDGRRTGVYGAPAFIVTGAPEGVTPPPGTQLLQNAPNPFHPTTRIRYQLAAGLSAAPVTLDVYDVAGRHVRRLVEAVEGAGAHEATWDGLDGAGVGVPSGIYFSRLTVGGQVWQRKMVLSR